MPHSDAHAFLFDELPDAFGGEAGALITQQTVETLRTQLTSQKQVLDSALGMVEQQIVEAVRQLFKVEQSTYGDILEAIRTWYNGLDSNQRDTYARWQDNDSKPLALNLKSVETLQDTFLVKIPQAYGMKAVRDWVSNRVAEYTNRLQSGKERIDANRLKVELPEIEFAGEYTRESGEPLMFKERIELSFKHKDNTARVYVAEGTADPTDPNDARAQVASAVPLVITDNKSIRYAAQDAEGNWSRIEVLQLINQNREFEFQVPLQPPLVRLPITINCPVDDEKLRVAARSLFRLGLVRQMP